MKAVNGKGEEEAHLKNMMRFVGLRGSHGLPLQVRKTTYQYPGSNSSIGGILKKGQRSWRHRGPLLQCD